MSPQTPPYAARVIPGTVPRRMAALLEYDILDTPTEPEFDDIAQLAAEIFEAPIAVVNLIADDRQWFKAEVGIGARELPLDVSICAHALLQADTMVVPDTRLDNRFACNPLVAIDDGLYFYAGALLKTPAGIPIGTVCVLDRVPRPHGITPTQKLTLEVLARQVMTQLELRREVRLHAARAGQLAHEEGERRLAEAARNDSQAFIRLLLDSTSEAFYSVACDGTTTLCNNAFLRMLGFDDQAQVIGRKLHDVIHHSHPDGSHYALADCPIYKAASQGTPAFVDDEVFFRSDASRVSVEYRAEPIWDNGTLRGAICTFVDISERQHAAERQSLLIKELDHRVKNLFAIVRGMVSLSARSATNAAELRTTIIGRLDALTAAHSLIRPGPSEANNGEQTSVTAICRKILDPYEDVAQGSCADIDGPVIAVGREAATSLAMVFHELATNAAKYGALSQAGGRVAVRWQLAGSNLELAWRETGGPAIENSPKHQGFGSQLSQRSVKSQLSGTIDQVWHKDGLRIDISIPVERLAS